MESLRSQPLIVMPCGHKHHLLCIKGLLQRRWPTPDISFNFMRCWCNVCARSRLRSGPRRHNGGCCVCMSTQQAPLTHPALQSTLAPLHELQDRVRRMAVAALECVGCRPHVLELMTAI